MGVDFTYTQQEVDLLCKAFFEKGRADAIYDFETEFIDMIIGNEEFVDWQKQEICLCLECAIEQLKEKKYVLEKI